MLDVRVAIKAMSSAEENMPKVLRAISSEFVGDVTEQVLNIIITQKNVPRCELVKRMKHRLTVRQLDIIIETLVEERVVEAARSGKDVTYRFIGVKK
jgi:hypothetical protein